MGVDLGPFGDRREFVRLERQKALRGGDDRRTGQRRRRAQRWPTSCRPRRALRVDRLCVRPSERAHDVGALSAGTVLRSPPPDPRSSMTTLDATAASPGTPVTYVRSDSPIAAIAASTGARRSSSAPRQFAAHGIGDATRRPREMTGVDA
ncbi:MAG: hypothetical protein R2692_02190 [Microbacterium sp.]